MPNLKLLDGKTPTLM
jgi:leucine-rich repeat-containing protein 49